MEISTDGLRLTGVDRINVVLGKNGCGKSTLLKKVSAFARTHPDVWAQARYITPERGGTLVYSVNVESSARGNPSWLNQVTERNQFNEYKQQTVYQFDLLQLSVLKRYHRENEAGHRPSALDHVLRINALLDNIEIRELPSGRGFDIFHKVAGNKLSADQISSGESELISLAIECLAFVVSIDSGSQAPSLLVLDEPDVHLHPDLQARLMRFLNSLVTENPNLRVLMATHSTAILGELSRYPQTTVAPMVSGQTDLEFESIDNTYRQLLPVFGAHPLTSVFRESPILLVEGTDEERVWQQALRTSAGRIRFYPVETGGVGNLPAFENRILKITKSVYEGARVYSLRDRDDGPDALEDLPPLVRMKLSCRASENLLLSNEVLARADTSWDEVRSRIGAWLQINSGHTRANKMRAFSDGGFNRKAFDLKEIRMILIADILISTKSWEFLIGQTIGMLSSADLNDTADGSIVDYLGEKLSSVLREMIDSP